MNDIEALRAQVEAQNKKLADLARAFEPVREYIRAVNQHPDAPIAQIYSGQRLTVRDLQALDRLFEAGEQ